MPKKSKKSYDTNVALWESDYGFSGTITFKVEFLEEIIEAYYDGDPLVVDDYDERYAILRLNINESEYDNGPDYYGSASIQKFKEEGKKKSRRKRR